MKNVLFASTALVAFAGAASAQSITLSGFAEMGLFDVSAGTGATNGVEFFTDIDVTFTMSGETDGGLTFGASVDLDEGGSGAAAVADNADDGGVTIFLSGAFGTLTMGDTDGALDWALTEVAFNSGSINDDETGHAGYNGNGGLDGTYDGQIVRYDNTFGDFGVAVSAELDDDAAQDGDAVLGLGFRYSVNLGGTDIGLGLGYQQTEIGGFDQEVIGVSANATFGSINAGINYSDVNNDGDLSESFDHFGIGFGYAAGAFSASLNYGEFDFDDGTDADGFGLSVGYDLGGGASLHLGYGTGENQAGLDIDTVSFGVAMSF